MLFKSMLPVLLFWFRSTVTAFAGKADFYSNITTLTNEPQIRSLKKDRGRGSEPVEILVTNEASSILHGTPYPEPYSWTNADGSKTPLIRVIIINNEVFEETVEGFTVRYINGYYVYMEYDSKSEALVASDLIAGVDDPKKTESKTSGNLLEKYEHLKLNMKLNANYANVVNLQVVDPLPKGNKKILIVPFMFKDHKDANRIVPSVQDLDILMNRINCADALCRTGSVRDYFLKTSFGIFALDSTIAPSWVTLPENEEYYAYKPPSNFGKMIRDALDALDALEVTGFDFTPYDAFGFFHSGYDAASGGPGSEKRVISHTGLGFFWQSSKSGFIINRYSAFSSLWRETHEIAHIGVVAHEIAHYFGFKDLYDYNDPKDPVPPPFPEKKGRGLGSYCLMANDWGFDNTQLFPPHPSAWSKIKAEWLLQPIDITSPGTYIARQACTYPDAFKISKNFPQNEYLLIENRFKCEYDLKIKGPGLAIYHVDEKAKVYGGKINEYEGYPGQPGWPENGNHYTVALLQADGLYNLEKGNNKGDKTDLFGATVTSIGPGGTSNGQTYPNTKAYQSGSIKDTCITIKNIGKPSAAVSFEVSFDCTKPVPAPKPKPVPRPVPLPKPKPVPRPVPLPKPKPVPRPVPLPKPKPAPTPSTVIFREDFLGSSLDSKNWVVEEGELDRTELGNTPIINGGIASLTFDTYGFKGTEIHTNKRYSRGSKGLEIEAKIKLVTPLPSGLVTSFYTWAENSSGSVDEIDVEILSKQLNQASDKALLLETYNDFHGDEKLPHYWSTSKSLSNLDVGTWHTFTIRWTPGRTYWLVDGVVVADSDKAQPNADSYIGLLFWAPDSDWPDAYNSNFQPVTKPASNRRYYFDIDYVEIRRLM